MPYSFTKGTNQYEVKTLIDGLSSDEIAIKFKCKDDVTKFFNPSIKNISLQIPIPLLAKNTAPSYCCRSISKNQPALSDQDYLELFYRRILSGELKVVQKSKPLKHSTDPIGWFDWDKFFSDPRVQPNFHELPAAVQIATIKAWQKEKKQMTIVDIFRPTKVKSASTSQGTIGIGFNAAAGMGKAASGTILIVFDEHGNMGYLKSGGFGGMGGSSISGTFLIQVTNARDIYQLKGLSVQTGASIGDGLTAGLEYLTGAGYHGVNFSFGIGAGLTPAELHSIAEYASVNGAKVDEIIAYVRAMKTKDHPSH